MTDAADVRPALTYIANASGQTWAPDRVAVWMDQLAGYDPAIVFHAAREFVKQLRGPARPADFLPLVRELQQRRHPDAPAPSRRGTQRSIVCSACAETFDPRPDGSFPHTCDPNAMAYYRSGPEGAAARQAKGLAACTGKEQRA